MDFKMETFPFVINCYDCHQSINPTIEFKDESQCISTSIQRASVVRESLNEREHKRQFRHRLNINKFQRVCDNVNNNNNNNNNENNIK